MGLTQPSDPAGVVDATRALFARVSRKARVVVPLNAAAADPQANGPGLYCIHSISGAGGTDFLALTRHFGGSVRMFGIQAPPRRMEEPEFGSSVPELGAAYAEAICEAQPSGPVVLAGWSAGATIALEIAHRLRACGRETALLVAIDGAPEIPAGLRPWDPRYWLRVGVNLPAWFIDCQAMDPNFVRDALLRRAKSFGSRARGLLRRRKPEVAPRLESFISLNRYPAAQRQFMARLYDAIMRYRPQVWDGAVTLYEARVGPAFALPQYLERWRRVAPRTERAPLEGNHLTIMREPRVADLARDLEQRIVAAVAQPPAQAEPARPNAEAGQAPAAAAVECSGQREPPEPRTPSAWAWSGAGVALALLLTAAALGGQALTPPRIELALRSTARLAFAAFWPCYAGGALVELFGPRFAPLKRRGRALGLAFAAVLAVHLGLVAALCAVGTPPPAKVFLIFGPGVLCALLLTTASINRIGRAIGPTGWWWLRNVATNYLVLDFLIDFWRREPLTTPLGLEQYLPFAVMAAVAPALRLAAWLKTWSAGMRGLERRRLSL